MKISLSQNIINAKSLYTGYFELSDYFKSVAALLVVTFYFFELTLASNARGNNPPNISSDLHRIKCCYESKMNHLDLTDNE